MTHWAGVIRECQESGLSVRAFAKMLDSTRIDITIGKKLREMAFEELALAEPSSLGMPKAVFAEVTLPSQRPSRQVACSVANQVNTEVQGICITAGGEYPAGKLSELLR
ncbi:MAG: hypothetical protein FWD05_08810 [Oscillospiraceae bacterium]|nr:hypothetical protein [Oscillospiraceae bacterium]